MYTAGSPEVRPPLVSSRWYSDTSEPVMETTVGGILRSAAERAPASAALIEATPDPTSRRRWSYWKLLEDAERAARALLGRFQPLERVAVWANNIPEWVILEYACGLANLTLVTVNPALQRRELAYVLRQSRVAGIFFVSDFRGNRMAASLESIRTDLPELREAVLFADWEEFCASGSPTERFPVVTPDDIAQIQYTSGTTGFPKGAMLHHRGITNNARFSLKRRDAATASVSANPMPLFHTASSCLMAVGLPQFDCCHVLFPYFDPGLVLQVCESEGATSLAGVPTMLIALMEHPDFSGRDLSRLHGVVSGGSTVPTELVRRIEATLGVTFTIQFGMTETSPTITQTWPHDSPEDKAETIGQPLPNAEVKIVHPDTFETVPAGVAGELWVRGYQVMKGYFDMLDETAQAIVDGWMRTGDLCSMDERGYCRVEGRLKDMIIRGGENIYPREIEELLFRHPKVAEAAVVGIPDARWGEQVVAFIRPAAGQSVREQDLFAYCRENLSPQKTPQQWVFVDELPTTPTGKVQKFVLRDRLLAKT